MKKHKLYTLEEFKNSFIKTPAQKLEYERSFMEFEAENERELLKELGQKIKKIREKKGITQDELAEKLQTKKSNISRLEHGKQNLSVEQILRVANALGRPVRVEIG